MMDRFSCPEACGIFLNQGWNPCALHSQVVLVKNLPADAGDLRDMGSVPELGRSPGEGNGNLFHYSFLGIPMDRGIWRAQSMGSQRVSTVLSDFTFTFTLSIVPVIRASLVTKMVKYPPAVQETRVQSLGQEDPLEKEMATHSSTLAWRIPWTEEPGGLQSMGSQRAGHD